MTRRMFLAVFPLALCACAKFRDDDWDDDWEEPEKPKVSEEELKFQRWLKKRHRYRDFETYDEAHEAYLKDTQAAEKKKQWLEYRKKMGASQ